MDGKEEMAAAARFSTEGTAKPGTPEDIELQLPRPGWPLNQFNTSSEILRATQKVRVEGQCLDPNTRPLVLAACPPGALLPPPAMALVPRHKASGSMGPNGL